MYLRLREEPHLSLHHVEQRSEGFESLSELSLARRARLRSPSLRRPNHEAHRILEEGPNQGELPPALAPVLGHDPEGRRELVPLIEARARAGTAALRDPARLQDLL